LAGAHGHADFLAGVAHARGNPRATAPAPGNLATTTAFNDYWLGVDHARTNARGVAYPAPSSAAAAGVAEYWAGVDHAVANPQAIAPPAGNSASAQGRPTTGRAKIMLSPTVRCPWVPGPRPRQHSRTFGP